MSEQERSQSQIDEDTKAEAREWVALLSDRPRALKWAEDQAHSWVRRFPERDLKKELAKWRKIALAGVEGSGIETEGL